MLLRGAYAVVVVVLVVLGLVQLGSIERLEWLTVPVGLFLLFAAYPVIEGVREAEQRRGAREARELDVRRRAMVASD